jgi:type I restriction enzyme M protein
MPKASCSMNLGLKDWLPSDKNTVVKSFAESFGRAGRLDAEYYKPKYQEAMSILSRSGTRIGKVADFARDKFNPNGISSFNYVEILDLSGEGYANERKVSIEDMPSRAQWVVKAGDVITSTVRPIRRLSALIEPEQRGFICSSGFVVLRPKAIQRRCCSFFCVLP